MREPPAAGAGSPKVAPPPFDVEDPLLARAAWSRLAEPGDEVARALVDHLGPSAALGWVIEAVAGRAGVRSVAERLATPDSGASSGEAMSGASVPGAATVGATVPRATARLARAVARWAPRLDGLDPRRELRILKRLDGRLVVPGDSRWPSSLDDLGLAAPLCLWVRGEPDLARLAARSVALVGARACTDYGCRVAEDMAVGLSERRFTVVSGGAYGIDAAAHRGALAADERTVAFLAGGVDRLYPAGNAGLLQEIVEAGGAVVSEVPPGSVPSRVRFLLRNRLIAAFSRATVVVEAAWRSGSLSTAGRAAELLRPVGAVPGPVTSMASSGCHRLLRETDAVCVTDAAEVAELAGEVGEVPPPRRSPRRPEDGLGDVGRRLWDALPVRSAASVESVARAAGLSLEETLGGLGHLDLLGLARRTGGGWARGGARG